MDYIYIRAYGKYMQLASSFINDELQMAHDDKAPGNVIFKRDDGTWATIEDINASDRAQIERLTTPLQIRKSPRTRTII